MPAKTFHHLQAKKSAAVTISTDMLCALLINTCTYEQEMLPHAFRNTYPAHKGKNLQFGSSTVHACISHLPSSSSSSGSSFKILAMRLLCAASSLACLRTFCAVSFHECFKSTLRVSLVVHVILRTSCINLKDRISQGVCMP